MIGPKAGFGRKRAAKVVSAGWGAPTDALDSTITSASPVGTSAGTSIVTFWSSGMVTFVGGVGHKHTVGGI